MTLCGGTSSISPCWWFRCLPSSGGGGAAVLPSSSGVCATASSLEVTSTICCNSMIHTKKRAFRRCCVRSTRARALGELTRGLSNLAPRRSIARGCGGSILTTHPPWSLKSTSTGFARLRLGCAKPSEPVPCSACQSGFLDSGAAHATCCALGEAARPQRGHCPHSRCCSIL